jgi:hypothetical protein
VDISLFFLHFRISRGHAAVWTFCCLMSFEYSPWTRCLVDTFCFSFTFIFLVDMLSCRHFVFSVILIFLVDMLSCGHFIIFLLLNIRLGHALWTFYCFSVILILIVDISLFFMLRISCGYKQNSTIKLCTLLQEWLKILPLILFWGPQIFEAKYNTIFLKKNYDINLSDAVIHIHYTVYNTYTLHCI